MSEAYYDKHGRQIEAGDLLKVYHFTTARRRRVYSHWMACEQNGRLRILGVRGDDTDGIHPSCLISEETEIIDGPSHIFPDGSMLCWWERPKQKGGATNAT